MGGVAGCVYKLIVSMENGMAMGGIFKYCVIVVFSEDLFCLKHTSTEPIKCCFVVLRKRAMFEILMGFS